MPAGGRYGPQALGGPFSHVQQPHLQQHHNQHHGPGSAGLPAPSFNSHSAFPQASQHVSMNSFGNHNGLAPGFGANTAIMGSGTGLGSEAAQMGFRHGANLQQQQAMRGRNSQGKQGQKSRVRDVWAGNLAQEMQNLRELVEKYPYISMDTEFPGIIARPMGRFHGKTDYHYQCLRTNVDLLSLLQLGITLFDENGDPPPPHPEYGPYQSSSTPCPHTWQFNFKFSMETDMYNEDSIKFLQQAGLNMEMHELQGIDHKEFGAMLITSGLALFEEVRWISFHAAYDFAYLVKLMHCQALPETEIEYRKLLGLYFPAIYDIKYITKTSQRTGMINGDTTLSTNAQNILQGLGTRSGLQDLADELQVKRLGPAHTAGSDSHLTGKTFWEFKRSILDGIIDDERYLGQVWGLNGLTINSSNNGAADGHTTPNLNGATIYNNGTPSTPGTSHTNLAQTPQQTAHQRGMGALTPGGGGGAFGQFGMR